jgi:multiple sugar transport system permease protein
LGGREQIALGVAVVLVAIWILFPIYWMVNLSLQLEPQVTTVPPYYLPPTPTLRNFEFVLNAAQAIKERLTYFGIGGEFLPAVAEQYPRAIVNSVVVSLCIVGINLLAGTLASYTFTRVRFWGHMKLFYASITGRLIPPIAVVVPYYIILFGLGLLDTIPAVVMIHAYFTLPLTIWILNTYLATIPEDIEDAARVDGYSRLETLRKVVFPLIRPGIVAIGIISFMMSWTEFFFAFMVTKTEAARTLPVVIGFMAAQPVKPVGIIMASGVLAMIPALVVIAVFRRYLIRGLVAGAVR